MKNWLGIIAITFALFASTVGALEYFAKAQDLELVAMRLDQKITNDQIMQVNERIWQLEMRHKDKPTAEWPESDLYEYRKLEEQKKNLQRGLEK